VCDVWQGGLVKTIFFKEIYYISVGKLLEI